MNIVKCASVTALLLFLLTGQSYAEQLKPEMIVKFKMGTLGCLERDDLQAILMHFDKGEKTKVEAMMVQNGGGCLMIPSSKRVKIISVEYNDPEHPDLGILELVGEGITSGEGAWALSVGAEQVGKHR